MMELTSHFFILQYRDNLNYSEINTRSAVIVESTTNKTRSTAFPETRLACSYYHAKLVCNNPRRLPSEPGLHL